MDNVESFVTPSFMCPKQENAPLELDIQRPFNGPEVPDDELFRQWAEMALAESANALLNIRIVDMDEGRDLNRRWRGRDSATNVLSFPASIPSSGVRILGDIVLCAPVVAREATEQGKPVEHHWAHLTVHGLLHLLGFDHTTAAQAEVMESREIELLDRLGIPNPYDLKS
jgi:probable rRNA maturation factor